MFVTNLILDDTECPKYLRDPESQLNFSLTELVSRALDCGVSCEAGSVSDATGEDTTLVSTVLRISAQGAEDSASCAGF